MRITGLGRGIADHRGQEASTCAPIYTDDWLRFPAFLLNYSLFFETAISQKKKKNSSVSVEPAPPGPWASPRRHLRRSRGPGTPCAPDTGPRGWGDSSHLLSQVLVLLAPFPWRGQQHRPPGRVTAAKGRSNPELALSSIPGPGLGLGEEGRRHNGLASPQLEFRPPPVSASQVLCWVTQAGPAYRPAGLSRERQEEQWGSQATARWEVRKRPLLKDTGGLADWGRASAPSPRSAVLCPTSVPSFQSSKGASAWQPVTVEQETERG